MNARTLSLVLALMLLATWATAQTRKIGHRSHSGSPATFVLLMDEDHLGAYVPRVTYNVDPFVTRVRLYYEKVARENPQPQAEVASDKKTADADSASIQPNVEPKANSIPQKHKSKHKGQTPEASIVPAPDFLVKVPAKAAPAILTTENNAPQGSLWILLVVLGCVVAPGIFVASAMRQRKTSAA